MADESTIDPRYDPAFQRGFDGTVATGSRAQAASRRSAPYVGSALQRPVPEKASTDPSSAIGLPPEAPSAADPDAAVAPVVVQAEAAPPRAPWTNPFVIAVSVLGIVMVAYGAWTLQDVIRALQSDEGFQTEGDYWLVQAGITSGPLMIAVGVAILAGVLFFCAGYWARRPHHPVEFD